MSDDRKSLPAPPSNPKRSGGMRMASSGFDLAIVVGGFTAIGWWLDRKYGWAPWGVLVGAILGIVGGLTNFLREARAAIRSSLPRRSGGRTWTKVPDDPGRDGRET